MKKIVLQLNSLPKRERKISAEEIQNVYGGCWPNGSDCSYDTDCCSQYCAIISEFLGTCVTG